MKKIILILSVVLVMGSAKVFPADEPAGSDDPKYLFYKANSFYEKGDYQGAIDSYERILAVAGLESGNLYYNIGNAYFKLGKLGYAVLFYERAHDLIPRDPDLASNLRYAQSLIEDSQGAIRNPWWARALTNLSGFCVLERLALVLSIAWALDVLLIVISILFVPVRRRLSVIIILLSAVLTVEAVSFGYRFSIAERLHPSVVISSEAPCKFEPFEKATTFFTLREGAKIYVIRAKGEWSYIRRLDGKKGWIERRLYEEI